MQTDIFNQTLPIERGEYEPTFKVACFLASDGTLYRDMLLDNSPDSGDWNFVRTNPKDPNQNVCSVFEFRRGVFVGNFPIGTEYDTICDFFADNIWGSWSGLHNDFQEYEALPILNKGNVEISRVREYSYQAILSIIEMLKEWAVERAKKTKKPTPRFVEVFKTELDIFEITRQGECSDIFSLDYFFDRSELDDLVKKIQVGKYSKLAIKTTLSNGSPFGAFIG